MRPLGLGLSWRICLGFCLFSRLRKPLWGVCWVESLTRWASEGPYKACGQIPEVPWNWHFVWIGVKSSVCPPSALSTQTKRGTLIASQPQSLSFRKNSENYLWMEGPAFLPNLCLSTWLLTLFLSLPLFPNSESILPASVLCPYAPPAFLLKWAFALQEAVCAF